MKKLFLSLFALVAGVMGAAMAKRVPKKAEVIKTKKAPKGKTVKQNAKPGDATVYNADGTTAAPNSKLKTGDRNRLTTNSEGRLVGKGTGGTKPSNKGTKKPKTGANKK